MIWPVPDHVESSHIFWKVWNYIQTCYAFNTQVPHFKHQYQLYCYGMVHLPLFEVLRHSAGIINYGQLPKAPVEKQHMGVGHFAC